MHACLREARFEDLDGLLTLYTHLSTHGKPNAFPEKTTVLYQLWETILNDPNQHIIVAEVNGMLASSCVLILVPNLTHQQRPYALIENVVTLPEYRKKGYGSAVLEYAKSIAIQNHCYKIMLMTGSKHPETLAFYRNAGYNDTDKTGFIQWI